MPRSLPHLPSASAAEGSSTRSSEPLDKPAAETEYTRLPDVYYLMARAARYRPAAPSDDVGGCC
jgi:hypothetical protein